MLCSYHKGRLNTAHFTAGECVVQGRQGWPGDPEPRPRSRRRVLLYHFTQEHAQDTRQPCGVISMLLSYHKGRLNTAHFTAASRKCVVQLKVDRDGPAILSLAHGVAGRVLLYQFTQTHAQDLSLIHI